MKLKRSSGIIMHISSLPSPHGIGTFGQAAYDFARFLKKSGQTYWQLLPLGPTSYGDSPYQSFSAMAGNPYFIDLDRLVYDGLLSEIDLANVNFGTNAEYVDYSALFNNRFKILEIAYRNFNQQRTEFIEFIEREKMWLDDYALYMAVKEEMNLRAWQEWDEDIKLRKPEALTLYNNKLAYKIGFWKFVQYQFFKQWFELKHYVNSIGIQFMGDIPIYVAADSVETWAHPNLFKLDEYKNPTVVAGCPPDTFSHDGQLWGNPIYNWDYHDQTSYQWWIDRINFNLKMFDIVRIDHFRGFEAYYEVPAYDNTARHGYWVKGPGMKLFDKVYQQLGDINVVAEDLGFTTNSLAEFLKDSGFPGMKVLEFAFSNYDESPFLPYLYDKHSITYTGTHDNDTLRGWIDTTGNKAEIEHCIRYVNNCDFYNLHWDIIRCAWSSVSDVAITQMQDILGLGNRTRMNYPSSLGGNWQWRMLPGAYNDEIANRLMDLTRLYGRYKDYQRFYTTPVFSAIKRPVKFRVIPKPNA